MKRGGGGTKSRPSASVVDREPEEGEGIFFDQKEMGGIFSLRWLLRSRRGEMRNRPRRKGGHRAIASIGGQIETRCNLRERDNPFQESINILNPLYLGIGTHLGESFRLRSNGREELARVTLRAGEGSTAYSFGSI